MSEYVGEHAVLNQNPFSFRVNETHRAHLKYPNSMKFLISSRFAEMMSKPNANPSSRSYYKDVDPFVKRISIGKAGPNNIPIAELVTRIGSGMIVDLGHAAIRLYAVHDNKRIEKKELPFGGRHVTKFFEKLLNQAKREVDLKYVKYGGEYYRLFVKNLIKDEQCSLPIDFEQTMKVKFVHKDCVENFRIVVISTGNPMLMN